MKELVIAFILFFGLCYLAIKLEQKTRDRHKLRKIASIWQD